MVVIFKTVSFVIKLNLRVFFLEILKIMPRWLKFFINYSKIACNGYEKFNTLFKTNTDLNHLRFDGDKCKNIDSLFAI